LGRCKVRLVGGRCFTLTDTTDVPCACSLRRQVPARRPSALRSPHPAGRPAPAGRARRRLLSARPRRRRRPEQDPQGRPVGDGRDAMLPTSLKGGPEPRQAGDAYETMKDVRQSPLAARAPAQRARSTRQAQREKAIRRSPTPPSRPSAPRKREASGSDPLHRRPGILASQKAPEAACPP
jgi:hypothetical protein